VRVRACMCTQVALSVFRAKVKTVGEGSLGSITYETMW